MGRRAPDETCPMPWPTSWTSKILNGSSGLFNGTNLPNHNVSAITTYGLYRDHLALWPG